MRLFRTMMKTLLLAAFCLLLVLVWVVEPLSYNPLQAIATPATQSSIDYTCHGAPPDSEKVLQVAADTTVNKFVESGEFLGVSVGLSKLDCGSYVAGAGFSSKRDQLRADGTMLSRIASITKPMTAIAIMQLYERGLIDLDAPVQSYLAGFPKTSKQNITTRQLLSHTSGIPHYKSKLDAISFTHYNSLTEAVDTINAKELANNPGEAFLYSSYGYTVLGAIIESVSGLEFEEYLSKNIWQKAGMLNTSLEREGDYPNKSRLYIKLNSSYLRSPYTDLSIIFPAGGVQSTAGDLLKFGEAILENKLVSGTTLEMMIDASHSLAPAAGDDPYGLGWVVYHHPENGKIIAHSGAQPGVSAYFEILLDKGIVVTALSNAFGTKNSAYHLSKEMVGVAL